MTEGSRAMGDQTGPDGELGLLEGLMTTRAMRRLTDEPVSDEDLWTCLRAAVQRSSSLTGSSVSRRIARVVMRPSRRPSSPSGPVWSPMAWFPSVSCP